MLLISRLSRPPPPQQALPPLPGPRKQPGKLSGWQGCGRGLRLPLPQESLPLGRPLPGLVALGGRRGRQFPGSSWRRPTRVPGGPLWSTAVWGWGLRLLVLHWSFGAFSGPRGCLLRELLRPSGRLLQGCSWGLSHLCSPAGSQRVDQEGHQEHCLRGQVLQ